jgi:hypothetical protein
MHLASTPDNHHTRTTTTRTTTTHITPHTTHLTPPGQPPHRTTTTHITPHTTHLTFWTTTTHHTPQLHRSGCYRSMFPFCSSQRLPPLSHSGCYRSRSAVDSPLHTTHLTPPGQPPHRTTTTHTSHHTPHTTHHTPHTTHHTPHTTHHTPQPTHHTPHITHHTPYTTHHFIMSSMVACFRLELVSVALLVTPDFRIRCQTGLPNSDALLLMPGLRIRFCVIS